MILEAPYGFLSTIKPHHSLVFVLSCGRNPVLSSSLLLFPVIGGKSFLLPQRRSFQSEPIVPPPPISIFLPSIEFGFLINN